MILKYSFPSKCMRSSFFREVKDRRGNFWDPIKYIHTCNVMVMYISVVTQYMYDIHHVHFLAFT